MLTIVCTADKLYKIKKNYTKGAGFVLQFKGLNPTNVICDVRKVIQPLMHLWCFRKPLLAMVFRYTHCKDLAQAPTYQLNQ